MAKTDEKLTPAMKQFHHFKQKYPDAVLFFRMGDFYETFHEDARTVSRELGLVLTSRGKSGGNPIPLAGLPYHAVDGYLKKMLQAGYKVAKMILLDRLMIETDCPYISPHPVRNIRPNEPALLVHTAQCLADVHGIPLEEFAEKVTQTSEIFFGCVDYK